jgi:hypothetical protein
MTEGRGEDGPDAVGDADELELPSLNEDVDRVGGDGGESHHGDGPPR